jgi:hypothetical protein
MRKKHGCPIGIFSLWNGGNSLVGNFLRRNEVIPLWKKFIKMVKTKN